MSKEIAVILGLAVAFVLYITWREIVPPAIGTNPGAAPAPVEANGPAYLIYNQGATAGGYGFNPGPPTANFAMPEMSAALTGQTCGCDPQSAGRF